MSDNMRGKPILADALQEIKKLNEAIKLLPDAAPIMHNRSNSRVFIFAGSYNQFETWCYENKISKRARTHRYLRNSQMLCGLINPVVIEYGSYYTRSDYKEIKDCIHMCSFPKESKGE